MKKIFWIVSLFVAVWALPGCDDDNDGPQVPTAVQAAFDAMFPDAKGVQWSDRNGYLVAGFDAGGTRTDVWYDADGNWYMTETDIAFSALPEAVRTAFAASEYAAWRIEEVEMLTREGMETLYAIEAERNDAEVELFYTADGVLVRASLDPGDGPGSGDHGDLLPGELPEAIEAFLAQKYPDARIIDTEREQGGYEVEIVFEGVKYEVLFDASCQWVRTQNEVRRSQLPEAVVAAWQASEYASWELDDADRYDSPEGEWYRLELENPSDEREATLRIRPDGTVF